ncbi:hypothetical protein ABC270_03635 [Curtobacterium sp. 1P10AnD]|uniref:hypothetical protein n=1 Tax=Curtobacterium sp. 1P10AnD TaxID=3132283 RepID=UPI00399F95C0
MKASKTIHARRTALVATATIALFASAVVASPANASESRITDEDARVIRMAMTTAGIGAATQDVLIAKMRAGELVDSERSDAHPVSRTVVALRTGGVSRTETFADGSQRTTSEVPITMQGQDGPVTSRTTYACNLMHCTALASRAQTKALASGYNAAKAVIIAMCGPAAWACAIGVGIMVDTALRAVSQRKCVGIRKFTTAAPVWPVIEACRQ